MHEVDSSTADPNRGQKANQETSSRRAANTEGARKGPLSMPAKVIWSQRRLCRISWLS